ncbi:YicC/YloC family endoribonuclease [Methylotenera sp.]|uniref:YicC/YloC family endoribonuclease n=1 Tax=Methylotenera sp. TaxID=2051956 RepID=UPI002730DDF4|nr:YicC/YloC family endoribonuclease [Methylotenera sp.]MDP2229410.1 YicC/YloC family endoribonuclease [Methylotenera sp.]MDP3141220.1 YicC/YloC family endoribonuclease [Methylotenera sp.]
MTFSMTGFAALEQPLDNATLILELRAVNSRYLDLHFKLDENLRSLEPSIRELISAQLSRGKIECKINLIQRAQAGKAMQLDEALMQQLAAMQEKVQLNFPQSSQLTIADILRWPGVVLNDVISTDTLIDDVKKLVQNGLKDLNASRAREGEKLKTLVLERLSQIESLVTKVKPLLPALTKEYQAKLESKLQETLKNIDQERIAQELVLFAQRIDVDEELTRLTAHVSEVKRILNSDAPAGKRLDFLMQELNREANTLGSKSVSVQTTQVSMGLKVLIEQMREQIQNIE